MELINFILECIRFRATAACHLDGGQLAFIPSSSHHATLNLLYDKPTVTHFLGTDGGMWIGLHSSDWLFGSGELMT